MQNNQNTTSGRDTAGMVMASLFILLSAVSLWDTTSMLDSDSYVFPRAVAIAMILFCLILITWNLLKPVAEKKEIITDASAIRRMLLVVIMLFSCVFMPWLGFLISGFEWTSKRKFIYPLVAVSVVAGFYTLFSKLLLVPLPIGLLFD